MTLLAIGLGGGLLWNFEFLPSSIEENITELLNSATTFEDPPPLPVRQGNKVVDLETLSNGKPYTPTAEQQRDLTEYLK